MGVWGGAKKEDAIPDGVEIKRLVRQEGGPNILPDYYAGRTGESKVAGVLIRMRAVVTFGGGKTTWHKIV
jgi:hypothetical protein